MSDGTIRVTFLPDETTTEASPGTTLFQAAAWVGRPVESSCGGRGTCGKCRVRLVAGTSPATPADQQHLEPAEIEAGWRLSCRAEIRSEMTVEVPRLLTAPKTAVFGEGRAVALEPNVRKIHLRLDRPELHDQRSDYRRLMDALSAAGHAARVSLPVLRTLPRALREADFEVTAVLCGDDLLGVEAGDSTGSSFGMAFDVGTTTIVGSLLDLATGATLGSASAQNPQAVHGGDVLSRISHAMARASGIDDLQRLAASALNGIIERLCAEAAVAAGRIYEVTLAGNATMAHLLLGIDPEPISVTPFTPAVAHGLSVLAASLGLRIHPQGRAYLFPCLGAYVGGDIVAGLLATGLPRGDRLRLFVDVGTNGEIALGSGRRAVATAAPAGPAFEGAEISCGMRATAGAIEGVRLTEDAVALRTIGNAPPVGLCGSGLIDAVAELYRRGLLDASGRMRSEAEVLGRVPPSLASRLVERDGVRAFVLATADQTGAAPVFLTQKDVRQLQFAKGAIATGIEVVMREMGVGPGELQEVLLAGAFGSYIAPASARLLGLVPPVPLERIRAVGNAAGEGAKIALLSYREREAAEAMPGRVEYLELSGRPEFNDLFLKALGFPPLDSLP